MERAALNGVETTGLLAANHVKSAKVVSASRRQYNKADSDEEKTLAPALFWEWNSIATGDRSGQPVSFEQACFKVAGASASTLLPKTLSQPATGL